MMENDNLNVLNARDLLAVTELISKYLTESENFDPELLLSVLSNRQKIIDTIDLQKNNSKELTDEVRNIYMQVYHLDNDNTDKINNILDLYKKNLRNIRNQKKQISYYAVSTNEEGFFIDKKE